MARARPTKRQVVKVIRVTLKGAAILFVVVFAGVWGWSFHAEVVFGCAWMGAAQPRTALSPEMGRNLNNLDHLDQLNPPKQASPTTQPEPADMDLISSMAGDWRRDETDRFERWAIFHMIKFCVREGRVWFKWRGEPQWDGLPTYKDKFWMRHFASSSELWSPFSDDDGGPKQPERLGFEWRQYKSPWERGTFVTRDEWARFTGEVRILNFPAWFTGPLILLAMGWTAWRLFVWLRRPRAGMCRGCGYDLRASVELCPECGRPIEDQRAAA